MGSPNGPSDAHEMMLRHVCLQGLVYSRCSTRVLPSLLQAALSPTFDKEEMGRQAAAVLLALSLGPEIPGSQQGAAVREAAQGKRSSSQEDSALLVSWYYVRDTEKRELF